MKEKWLYIMLGLMAGIILMLFMERLPAKSAYAREPANLDSASANGFIALTTIAPTTNSIVLWVLDTSKKKLLIYEYTNDKKVTFKTFRDVQYDFNIPDGLAGSFATKKPDWDPLETKKYFEEIKKRFRKPEKPK